MRQLDALRVEPTAYVADAASSPRCAGATADKRDVFSVIARHAASNADATALSGAGRSWTFEVLVDHGERLAAALISMCPETDVRVAVVADNHPLTCLVYLACARAGLVVSLINSRFRESELAIVFAKLEPHLVIADAAHHAAVDGALREVGFRPLRAALDRDGSGLPSVGEWTKGRRHDGPLPDADAVLEISWTSGTTSAPKGVMLTHDAALYRAECEVDLFGLGAGDTSAVITPLFHQSGIRNTVLATWLAGGHAVILPRFDAATFWADMARFRVTYLCMVETILLMLDRREPCVEEHDNTLRRVLAAGDPDVVRRSEQRFGFRVVQVWGMTETGVSTGVPRSMPLDTVNMLRDWGKGAPVAGWALGSSFVRLVRDGREVRGEGAQGEIQFASRMLLSRYFRDQEATAAAFDGDWFKTGDLGMYGPDGVLYFLDRIKDVIRRGGENIASKQVEDVLAAHPRVGKAAVIPVPDPLFLQEVMAVVVPSGDVTAEDLWSWCDERLARYKVPRYISLTDGLPMNSSGRVQKRILVANALTDDGRTFDRRSERERS
ncbi:class I adenylate-forming enzyme family protein [Mesorhizobium sp. IMUNJ 23232]|uniref:class I adenylate-forming enzyme family protein n=1 Tax=Mesorhizobium sp. IMUNJ 23232 TaxID=3376064 RepID=UPI0037A89E6D